MFKHKINHVDASRFDTLGSPFGVIIRYINFRVGTVPISIAGTSISIQFVFVAYIL